ncbi:hypothetical protein T4B_8202 [Trichinella pseudospiralis]|uniref:Uncharacterized protein n=1 Tax=Trichinella pseudospiralis TaxID=6337 RepID=A0A0V1GCQ2_TRIPS|nr:hypothetical protein T4C_7218 [Trichinella pseudospiralis]KRY99803.1 hypothetical protein T4B_8202 [Trichinella pseudospiralis]
MLGFTHTDHIREKDQSEGNKPERLDISSQDSEKMNN